MDKQIRILLADDHRVLRQGMAQALEAQPDMVVVAQANNGLEAVELVEIGPLRPEEPQRQAHEIHVDAETDRRDRVLEAVAHPQRRRRRRPVGSGRRGERHHAGGRRLRLRPAPPAHPDRGQPLRPAGSAQRGSGRGAGRGAHRGPGRGAGRGSGRARCGRGRGRRRGRRRRRHGQQESYLMSSGRAAKLPKYDPLSINEYLVVPKLDAGSKQGRIFLAAPLSLEELRREHSNLFSKTTAVFWDNDTRKVIASDRLCLGGIVVEEQPAKMSSPEQVTQALLSGIKSMGISSLPWGRDSRQLQARINCLRSWQPNELWPDLSDSTLIRDLSWLTPYLAGISKAGQLKQLNLQEIFMSMLGWEKQQLLKRLAPTSLTVASGSRIRLHYQEDAPPFLAVRIQEMFGLQETPVICNGKVSVLLHLLSPAQRPLQVTTDLAGFWQRTYPEIKKELKGRYPKHFWPDDPLAAAATTRTKKT